MSAISEVELSKHVIAWLESQGWDVYQEVQVRTYGGRADIIATNGFLVWVIEVKRTLTLGVMGQASRWRSHFRSIAIPATKRRSYDRDMAYHIARNFFNIGVLSINQYGDIVERVPAPLMREHHRFATQIRKELKPEHKIFAEAGSNRGGYYTPYRATVIAVRRFIKENQGCTIKEIFDHLGKMHYATMKSARATMKRNLETIESEWCRIDTSEKPFRYFIRDDIE